MSEKEKLGIIGLGNPLKGDDGIGVKIIEELRNRKLPKHLTIFDLGTGGMKVLHVLKELDKVLIVDAVRFGGEPGDHVFFEPHEIKSLKTPKGTHDSNLFEVIELSKQLEEIPRKIVIMGIQPQDTGFKENLSGEVSKNFDYLIECLIEKIKEI